jgi:hypothetical protein
MFATPELWRNVWAVNQHLQKLICPALRNLHKTKKRHVNVLFTFSMYNFAVVALLYSCAGHPTAYSLRRKASMDLHGKA